MKDWSTPDRSFSSDDEAVRWWLMAHFEPVREPDERGVGGMSLYASYLACAARHTKLPIITGTMFGRIAGATVERGRIWDGRCVKVAYMVRPKDGLVLESPPQDEEKRGSVFIARHLMHAAAKQRAGAGEIWQVRAKDNEGDRGVILAFLDTKADMNPVLELGRRMMGLAGEADPLRLKEVRAKELWSIFPKNGWSYVKFLMVLGQVTPVKRTAAKRVAVLERRV